MIPGAAKAATATMKVAPTQCGGAGGLVTASGTTGKTICCKQFSTLLKLKNLTLKFQPQRNRSVSLSSLMLSKPRQLKLPSNLQVSRSGTSKLAAKIT